jgi:hypothetical protein
MKKSSGRKEELERLRGRYAGREKEGKTRLLDEFCEHTAMSATRDQVIGRSVA